MQNGMFILLHAFGNCQQDWTDQFDGDGDHTSKPKYSITKSVVVIPQS